MEQAHELTSNYVALIDQVTLIAIRSAASLAATIFVQAPTSSNILNQIWLSHCMLWQKNAKSPNWPQTSRTFFK